MGRAVPVFLASIATPAHAWGKVNGRACKSSRLQRGDGSSPVPIAEVLVHESLGLCIVPSPPSEYQYICGDECYKSNALRHAFYGLSDLLSDFLFMANSNGSQELGRVARRGDSAGDNHTVRGAVRVIAIHMESRRCTSQVW